VHVHIEPIDFPLEIATFLVLTKTALNELIFSYFSSKVRISLRRMPIEGISLSLYIYIYYNITPQRMKLLLNSGPYVSFRIVWKFLHHVYILYRTILYYRTIGCTTCTSCNYYISSRENIVFFYDTPLSYIMLFVLNFVYYSCAAR